VKLVRRLKLTVQKVKSKWGETPAEATAACASAEHQAAAAQIGAIATVMLRKTILSLKVGNVKSWNRTQDPSRRLCYACASD